MDWAALDALPSEPNELLQAAQNLGEKLSDAQAAACRDAGAGRTETPAADKYFAGRSEKVLPFSTSTATLATRIQEAVQSHNRSVGASSGSRVGTLRVRDGDLDRIEFENGLGSGRFGEMKLSKALLDIEAWDVLDDLKRYKDQQQGYAWGENYDPNLGSRSGVKIEPDRFDNLRVVVSRDPILLGECSTGQRWRNCFTEGASRSNEVAGHIRTGALIAYLVDKDDHRVRYPLMRQLLTVRTSSEGETIYIPDGLYGGNLSGSRDAKERFENIVWDIAQELNEGKSGEFSSPNNFWVDRDNHRRIITWGLPDLDKEVRTTVHDALSRKVASMQRFDELFEARHEAAEYNVARQQISAAAARLDRVKSMLLARMEPWKAKALIVEIRDCAVHLGRDVISWDEANNATSRRRAVLEAFLAAQPPETTDEDFRNELEALGDELSAPSEQGDLLAAHLIVRLSYPDPNGANIDEENRLQSALSDVVGSRSVHAQKLARDWIEKADEKLTAAYDGLRRLSEVHEIDSLREAFGRPWYDLRHAIGDYFGGSWYDPSPWSRFIDQVRSTGLRDALETWERRPHAYASPFALLGAKLDQLFTGTKKRDDFIAALEVARSDILPKWEQAAAKFELPGSWRDRNKNEALLSMVRDGRYSDSRTLDKAFWQDVGDDRVHPDTLLIGVARNDVVGILKKIQDARDELELAGEIYRDVTLSDEWVGARGDDASKFCWLTDIPNLVEQRRSARRAAKSAANEVDIAFNTYVRIRRYVHGEPPSPAMLKAYAKQFVDEKYPFLNGDE